MEFLQWQAARGLATCVPKSELRWCQPQAFVWSLLVWFQVSLPQLQSLAVPEETSAFFPCPGFLIEGQVEVRSEALQGQNPCRGMVVLIQNPSS